MFQALNGIVMIVMFPVGAAAPKWCKEDSFALAYHLTRQSDRGFCDKARKSDTPPARKDTTSQFLRGFTETTNTSTYTKNHLFNSFWQAGSPAKHGNISRYGGFA
jgi:hypothetical protein